MTTFCEVCGSPLDDHPDSFPCPTPKVIDFREAAAPRLRLRELWDRLFLYARECPVCDQNIIDDNVRCTCFDYEMPNASEILDIIDAILAEWSEDTANEVLVSANSSKTGTYDDIAQTMQRFRHTSWPDGKWVRRSILDTWDHDDSGNLVGGDMYDLTDEWILA